MTDEIPKFRSTAWFRIRGRGWLAEVPCDKIRDRENTGLVGKEVSINDELLFCIGVESNALGSPIREGERIGLLVCDIEDKYQEFCVARSRN